MVERYLTSPATCWFQRVHHQGVRPITADPDNLDKFLEALAHMIVAAKEDEEGK